MERIDIGLLDKYLAGEATQAEAAAVEGWAGSPALSAESLRDNLRSYPSGLGSPERLQALVADKLGKAGDQEGRVSSFVAARSNSGQRAWLSGSLPQWIGYAAVAGILMLGVYYAPPLLRSSNSIAETRTYTTNPGQRADVTLADGSHIILAPDSRLRYSVNGSTRTVEMAGEGYFTVRADAKSPFTVRTIYGDTRVLGTSFVVRNYANEARTRVVVSEGRVSVNTIVLNAGQGVTVTSDGLKPVSDADLPAALAWTSGRLVFNNTRMPEVIAHLERWYGVQFVGVDSELRGATFNAVVQSDRLTDETLHILGAALGRKLEQKGRTIHVSVPQ